MTRVYYYPYLKWEDQDFEVGPLFEEELQAGAWLVKRLAKHLANFHNVSSSPARWLEEVSRQVSHLLNKEVAQASCPSCQVSGYIGQFSARRLITRKDRFTVTGEGGREPDRLIHQGLPFRTAMIAALDMVAYHARKYHGVDREEDILPTYLSAHYRCRCGFTVQVTLEGEA